MEENKGPIIRKGDCLIDYWNWSGIVVVTEVSQEEIVMVDFSSSYRIQHFLKEYVEDQCIGNMTRFDHIPNLLITTPVGHELLKGKYPKLSEIRNDDLIKTIQKYIEE